MLTLLIKSVVFIVINSAVGAALLCYVTRLRRFSGFFVTMIECSTLALFIVTGFTAIFVRILRHLLGVTSYVCPATPDNCSLTDAHFLLLDSTCALVLFFTTVMTVVQFLMVREQYRITDTVLLAVVWFSCVSGSVGWYLYKQGIAYLLTYIF